MNSTAPFLSPEALANRPVPRSARILYAEDMAELRDLMELVLRPEGHQLETSRDGLAALERLREQPGAFDLVITDHHMPRMNGLDLVRAIRSLPYTGRIVVFSSELSLAVNAEYLRHGVERVLEKPVRPAELRQIIRDMFP